ncbi:MAG TPA: DMT family transporter [Aggregatilinea sp.]|uniref:DMT family transporter n=1 Tax=Aggregatilinea sp. TaxID=2806333 RepID=UPI002BEE2CC4|nr:DMT family transporter [Aggregatilinea sp.]HML24963.1 DMT family transporter [Aggregatilinea sp.]
MFTQLKFPTRMHRADVAMSLMVIVWGVHYIVVKDAFGNLAPLTFNAIRFMIGLPILLLAVARHPASLKIARRDALKLIPLGLIGPFGYQIFFVLGLARTTTTNTALLGSTMPLWTAILTIVLGIIVIRRQMIAGVIMSVIGVVLVVLGSSGTSLSISGADLVGSMMALASAMVTAYYNITVKPIIDRYGGTVVAVWTYVISTVGLIVVSSPDLLSLTPADVPTRVWPHLVFSGAISCALGFLIENYSLRTLGPARTALYYNFTPLVAAISGVAFMGDPLTLALIAGAGLTVAGTRIVRRNTWLRMPNERASEAVRTRDPQPELRGAEAA